MSCTSVHTYAFIAYHVLILLKMLEISDFMENENKGQPINCIEKVLDDDFYEHDNQSICNIFKEIVSLLFSFQFKDAVSCIHFEMAYSTSSPESD